MVVKSQIKFIKSLQQKKHRTRNGMFVAEGIKTIRELLDADFKPVGIYSTKPDLFRCRRGETVPVSGSELRNMSSLKTPNKVLAVFSIPPPKQLTYSDWVVALDGIRDPGNLGTIIRLCDWFGIAHLLCSPDSVDCYNPKVLQATMGSLARVNVVYQDIPQACSASGLPVYGAFMDGTSVYDTQLPKTGILVMGNEANGISDLIGKAVTAKIGIPQFGEKSTESLNVATAAAILLHELRRPAAG